MNQDNMPNCTDQTAPMVLRKREDSLRWSAGLSIVTCQLCGALAFPELPVLLADDQPIAIALPASATAGHAEKPTSLS